ncbi:hypothetical protein SAMN04488062_10221 [Flavobacterium omnivorum]|uniref:Uncharacterized protein n=1 Tax=Flavobacterium omnivorum TaxID=178355 RepID=A0A1G7WTD8_9FLAO|nr:hypothetical protein SAMN04488062_10221 [Flavobacterium omnivorum]
MERLHDTLEVKLAVSVRENIVLIMPKKANCQFARTNIIIIFKYPTSWILYFTLNGKNICISNYSIRF